MAETAVIDTDAVRQVQEYIRREFNALLRPLTHPVSEQAVPPTPAEAVAGVAERASAAMTAISAAVRRGPVI